MNAISLQRHPPLHAAHLTPAPLLRPTPPSKGIGAGPPGGHAGPFPRGPASTVLTSACGDRTQKTEMEWNMESCFCRPCLSELHSTVIIIHSTVC
jgi:hypothetical protein